MHLVGLLSAFAVLLLASQTVWSITLTEQLALNDMIDNIPRLSTMRPPWLRDVDPCGSSRFQGLLCRSGVITFIEFTNFGLSGRLPDSIGFLTGLEKLLLFNNELNGTLPSSISNLRNLTTLTTFGNNFAGPFPDGITTLPKLSILNIQQSGFSGPYPSNWSNSLTAVDISGNNWTGELPLGLIQLPQLNSLRLERLSLQTFNFTSFIEASNLPNLTTLIVSGSNISGPIPSFCSKMNQLRTLYLNSNKFSGKIGPGLGCLSELQDLNADTNPEISEMTDEIANLRNLTSLSLSSCRVGSIPEFLATMPRLRLLRLTTSQLNGTIPPALFMSQTLSSVSLVNNNLTGTFPETMNMPELVELAIDNNPNLGGVLPQGLTNSTKLRTATFANTRMSGTIPASIGSLNHSLVSLSLSRAAFTGPVPDSLWNLTNMISLDLSFVSNLTADGLFPSGLANLVSLQNLYLARCNLVGTIPSFIYSLKSMRNLVLNGNRLQGTIDSSIANLNLLNQLLLSENMLSGELPSAISYSLPLNNIQLSDNANLTGCIESPTLACSAVRSQVCGCSRNQCGVAACRIIRCAGTQPTADSICSFGRWVIPRSVVVNGTTILIRVTISGSLIISNTSITTVVVSDNNATLTVEGCVTFGGTLNVTLQSLPTQGDKYQIASFGGYCDNLATRFDRFDVYSPCGVVSGGTLNYTDRTLSLSFGGGFSDGCSNAVGGGISSTTIGIIVGCVLGAVLLIAIVLAVLVIKVPRVRQALFPFRDRETTKTDDL